MDGDVYNKNYFDNYNTGEGKVNYRDSSSIKAFLASVADRIVSELHPRTVLDAGCATGHLVAALRDRGVEAYGIDISEYAISQVREDIQPFCAVCSLTEHLPDFFPEHFDLVTSIEVLEHLRADDGEKAVRNLTALTDQVLFSSSPDDFEEPTHINVQQREYWARIFAECGFYDNLLYRPFYLTGYAVLYQKPVDPLQAVEDYERFVRQNDDSQKRLQNELDAASKKADEFAAENEALRGKLTDAEQAIQLRQIRIAELQAMLAKKEEETLRQQKQSSETANKLKACEEKLSDQLEKIRETAEELSACTKALQPAEGELIEPANRTDEELAHYKLHYHAAINQREELKKRVSSLEQELAGARHDYSEISNAFFWKITKPARYTLIALRWSLRPHYGERFLRKGLYSLLTDGVRVTEHKTMGKILSEMTNAQIDKPGLFTLQELAEQRKHQFPRRIKFSIVVPLYNTLNRMLRAMIDSVLAQTYPDWELCMADGSDAGHSDVKRICRKYARHDRRVRYQKLEKNLGKR